MAKYKIKEEIVLSGNFKKDIQVPEIRIRYNKGKTFGKLSCSNDVYTFLKKVYGRSIDIQEHFIVLLLDNSNSIIGYYRHTTGTPVSTVVDKPMILGLALKSFARSIILSHNHPSGEKKPSQADIKLTGEIVQAAKTMGIQILDHLIITKKDYYSFADHGRIALSGINHNKAHKNIEDKLRQEVYNQLQKVNQNKMLTPKIHDIIQTKNGYKHIEQRIINMVINDRITISACIPHIESEL